MLHRLAILSLAAIFLSSCGKKRNDLVKERRQAVSSLVSLEDNIFSAKEKLQAAGFQIKYGPDFPTQNKTYLEMIVDYGARPSNTETFKYSVGIGGRGNLITGIIRATPDGKIVSIK